MREKNINGLRQFCPVHFFMPCTFQTLYFSDDGFVARCGDCGQFHLAYKSAMFIMPADAYENLCKVVQYKLGEADFALADNCKSVMIPTHSKSAFIMLTRAELVTFAAMLEEADSEYKALSMIHLFNTGNQTSE